MVCAFSTHVLPLYSYIYNAQKRRHSKHSTTFAGKFFWSYRFYGSHLFSFYPQRVKFTNARTFVTTKSDTPGDIFIIILTLPREPFVLCPFLDSMEPHHRLEHFNYLLPDPQHRTHGPTKYRAGSYVAPSATVILWGDLEHPTMLQEEEKKDDTSILKWYMCLCWHVMVKRHTIKGEK